MAKFFNSSYSYCVAVANVVQPADLSDSLLSRTAAGWLFVMLSCVFLVSLFYHAPEGNYSTICGFKNLTGLPCPGCGLVHSFCALAKGHISSAFSYNALGPILFLVSIALWARAAFTLAGREEIAFRINQTMARARVGTALLIAFVAYGAGRIIYLLVSQPALVHTGYLAKFLVLLRH